MLHESLDQHQKIIHLPTQVEEIQPIGYKPLPLLLFFNFKKL